jgi:predicted DNA-binding transcriptional regulator YafY
VLVHAPADRVAQRLPLSAGTVQAVDEHSCAVEVGADNPELLAVWLGALGEDFTVVEAPELAEQLERLADRYRRAVGATG